VFLAAIMVLSVVAASAAFAGTAAAQAEAGVTVTDGPTPDPVNAGDSFDLTVEVTNTGDEAGTVTGVQASDVPSGVDVTFPDGDVSVTGLAPGESTTFAVSADVADDVENGDYSFTVEGQVTDSFTGSTSVDFTVGNSSGSDYNLDGGPATVGPTFSGGYTDLEGQNLWQGQEFTVVDGALTAGTAVSVYERIDTDSTQLETEVSADAGSVTVDTEDFAEGNYFLYAPSVGFGVDRSTAKNNEDQTFGVTEQSLTADFDEDSVTDEGQNSDTDFEFDSNRGSYPVNVTTSSGDLDAEQLADIFVAGSSFELATSNVNGDDDTISLQPESDADDFTVDFQQADIDTGEYEFVFEGTDSTASDTDTITVNEADQSASFTEGVSQTPAGDIAGFNLTLEDTDDAYVQIGGEDSDFVDVLYVNVDDGDEPVEVDINTRLLGTSAGIDQVYDVDNTDDFESEVHGGISASNTPDGASLYEDDGTDLGNNFEDYVDAIGIADPGENQITRPLQSTDYDVIAAGSNSVDYVFDADPGGEANDELGSKVLELQQPEIGDITTHTAPEDDADEDDEVQDLLDAATQREEIAVDDRLVVQVEATGLYGTMVAGPGGSGSDFDRLSDGASTTVLNNIVENSVDQIDFSIEAESATGNQDPLEVDLSSSDSDSYIVLDENNGQFFVVVDTSSDSAFANGDAPDSDTDFTASLEYDADNEDDRFSFENSGNAPFNPDDGADNYPYLLQGETLSNSADLTLSPRSIVYDNLNDDQVVEVAAGDSAEVSGTTNVAPGSDATIRVSSTDASSSFRQGNDVNISEDGSITTTYDLSDQEVGDEFDINYRVAGSSVLHRRRNARLRCSRRPDRPHRCCPAGRPPSELI